MAAAAAAAAGTPAANAASPNQEQKKSEQEGQEEAQKEDENEEKEQDEEEGEAAELKGKTSGSAKRKLRKLLRAQETAASGAPQPQAEAESQPQAEGETPGETTGANDPRKCNAFVKGLPWDANEAGLKEFFAEAGKITAITGLTLPDGRGSGVAELTFATGAAAAAALKKNGAHYGGRLIAVTKSSGRPKTWGAPTSKPSGEVRTVFVGNLAWDVTDDAMRKLFSSCGEISTVRLSYDKHTGNFRGFGHIDFKEQAGADEAIKLYGETLLGREIRVDYAPDYQKATPKKDKGKYTKGGGGSRWVQTKT